MSVLMMAAFWLQATLYVADGTTRTTVRNLNGREVPVESVEDRVVTKSAGFEEIERIIRRYDANGRPGPPEKQRIETRTGADGSRETSTTIWRGDINGNLQVAERSLAVTRQSGQNSETTTTVERAGSDGRFEVYEKKQQVQQKQSGERVAETSTTQRRDLNGRWADVLRSTREENRSNGQSTENRADYEAAATGEMRLVRQTVTRTVVAPSGASTSEIDVYEPALAGRAGGADDRNPKLTRQQIVERTPAPGGVVESRSVRFVDPSSPGRLGAIRKVEETTCKGACQPAMMK